MTRVAIGFLAVFNWVALLLALSTSGCGWFQTRTNDALDAMAVTANHLNDAAEKAEGVLTSVCLQAQLDAVDKSETAEQADQAIAEIQKRCDAAWQDYDRFMMVWRDFEYVLELARATNADPEISKATSLLSQLIQLNRSFTEQVGALLYEYGPQ